MLGPAVPVVCTSDLSRVDPRWIEDNVQHAMVDLADDGADQLMGGKLLCWLREADPSELKSIVALVRRGNDHAVQAINAAADDVLYEPLDRDELRTRLALGTRRAARIGGLLSVGQYRASGMQRVQESLPMVLVQFQINHKGQHRIRFEVDDFARRGMVIPTCDQSTRTDWSQFVSPIDRQRVIDGLVHAARTRSSWSDEFTLLDSANRSWRVRGFAFIEKTDEQNVSTWNAILLDVTEVSLLEQEVRQATAMVDRQSAFLASVGEALVVPARELVEASDLLAQKAWGDLTWQQAEAVTLIQRSSRWLDRTIEDLVELSRLATDAPLHSDAVSLPAMCERAMARAEPMAESRDVLCSLMLDSNVIAVNGDTRLLMRICNDLATLGAFASAPGSEMSLEMHGIGTEDEVRLNLWLSSPIIPPTRIAELFDPLKPLEALDSSEWNPGLAVAAAAARAHGGGLHAAVDPDGGMQIVLSLPWPVGPEWRRPATSSTIRIPTIGGDGPSLSVVVMDSNDAHLAVVCRRLQTAGFTCSAVSTPLQLIEAVHEHSPDLVLLDVTRGGVELVHRLRRITRRLSPMRVICMSSMSTPAERNLMLAAGADHYLYKPLTPSRILALRELMGGEAAFAAGG